MTGMVWRCGHARTAENTASGKQCRACKNLSSRKAKGMDDTLDDGPERIIAAGEMAQGSELLLRAICRDHMDRVSKSAAIGRNVRVLL